MCWIDETMVCIFTKIEFRKTCSTHYLLTSEDWFLKIWSPPVELLDKTISRVFTHMSWDEHDGWLLPTNYMQIINLSSIRAPLSMTRNRRFATRQTAWGREQAVPQKWVNPRPQSGHFQCGSSDCLVSRPILFVFLKIYFQIFVFQDFKNQGYIITS